MTMRRPRHLALRALGFGALGTGLVVAACEAPHPTGLKTQPKVALTSITNVSPEKAGTGLTAERVRAAIDEKLPALARGTGRAQMAWFVEDASGRITNAAFGVAPTRPAATSSSSITSLQRKGDSITYTATIPAASRSSALSSPAWMATLDPSTIESVEVLKMAPGRVAPDSTSVIWVRLRPASAGTAVRTADPDTRRAYTTGLVAGRTDGMTDAGSSRARAAMPDSLHRVAAGMAQTPGTPAAAKADSAVARMTRTPSGPSAPIYVVDGKIVPAGPNGQPTLPAPGDIDRVDVYKGDMARQLYGDSAGTGGVVKITTKKAPR